MSRVVPLLNGRAKFRREADQWVLTTPSGRMVSMNDTAALVLQLCTGSRDINQIKSLFVIGKDKGTS